MLPFLKARWERSHGADRLEAGLKLLSFADVATGSENGSVLIPEYATNSPLIELIVPAQMPSRAPRMPRREVEIIHAWVEGGTLDK